MNLTTRFLETDLGVCSAKLAAEEGIGTRGAHRPSENELKSLWFSDPEAEAVLIVGNSHSKDMFNALTQNSEAFRGLDFARFGMNNKFTPEQQALLFASANFEAAHTVLIAAQYNRKEFANTLPPFIEALKDRGKHVVLVGNTAAIGSPGVLPLFDWATQKHGQAQNADELNRLGYDWKSARRQKDNTRLQALAMRHGIPFLSRHALVCSVDTLSCTLITDDGYKAMYDGHHWTLEGAKVFGARAAKQGWDEVLRTPK